jgi:5'-deoxynucleotidase YfbR-like HD superfamily hydrolase
MSRNPFRSRGSILSCNILDIVALYQAKACGGSFYLEPIHAFTFQIISLEFGPGMPINNQCLDNSKIARDMLDLAKKCVDFSRVERSTYYPDGRRETDSEHSYMLGLIAMGLARQYFPELQSGLVAEFSFIHDLVELRIGDTPTFHLEGDQVQIKEAREHQALVELQDELHSWTGLLELLDTYEQQVVPEARFVRVIDKAMPALVNILDQGRALLANHEVIDRAQLEDAIQATDARMEAYSDDQSRAMLFKKAVSQMMVDELFG